MAGRSSGQLARLAGWTSLAGLGAIVAIWVVRGVLAVGPLSPFGLLLSPLMSIAVLATVLGAVGALLLGVASLVTGQDSGDALIGLGAAVPALVVIAGVVILILAFVTSDQPLFG